MSNLKKKLSFSVTIIIILVFCLLSTSVALAYSSSHLEEIIIKTGNVSINLNDGNPVIEQDELLFEPGMNVEKTFTLKNNSAVGVWYRFYFTNVSGILKDVLIVTIKDGDILLYTGKMEDISKSSIVPQNEKELASAETRTFKISFYYPSESTNVPKNSFLQFNLVADAVQSKNNPNRVFND